MKKNNFLIGEKNKHLTQKVILGYILFAVIAFGSILYILNVLKELSVDDGAEKAQREKAYLITRTISLLNESAALGQPIGMTEEDFDHFNATMDETQQYMGELRLMLTDSLHVQGVDTIEVLLENKRLNISQLYALWQNMNTERSYNKDIKKLLSDSVITQVGVKEHVKTKKDSVVIVRKKKGFFKRLADAFVPPKEDVGVVINTTSNMQKDTTRNIYNPLDTISSVLKNFQEKIEKERKQLTSQLYVKAAELRHNNTLINTRINQILYSIEEEEMIASMERLEIKQELYEQSTRILGVVAIIAILIILVFVMIISRDVSKSKYYRTQLEKAKQYADELLVKQEKFMLAISHDIRAPLSSILGYIELLLKKNKDDRQQYYLENMVSSSNHILSLVNNLLDFHRLDSGKMEIQKVAFNVNVLFDDIFASFKPIADAKKLDFKILLDKAKLDVNYSGDTIRIRQVVSNLLSNAIKFTREGHVILSVDVKDEELVISVNDSGPGIPIEEQDAVFGEFTRLKKEKKEGFGLGLSITRKLVELMGGTISLYSKPGEGSLFRVKLPLEVPESKLQSDLTSSDTTEPVLKIGHAIKCLIVDDDALQLALTKELLKQNEIEIESCTDSLTVLSLLEKQKFDIVITDIQMPGLNGFELVKQIRGSVIPGAATLPVVALSASVANEKGVYLDAGFTGFLNKPFTAKELITVLNDLLATDFQMETKLDFSSLTDFAGDDKEALLTILNTFEKETAANVNLLKTAFEQNDREKASNVAHKMIPVFSMIGANQLVQRLRLLEKNDSDLSDECWKSLMEELDSQINVVMKDVSEQICRL